MALVNEQLLRDGLHILSKSITQPDGKHDRIDAIIYGRGYVCGVMTGFCARGWPFAEAISTIKLLLPADYDIRCIPDSWVHLFK